MAGRDKQVGWMQWEHCIENKKTLAYAALALTLWQAPRIWMHACRQDARTAGMVYGWHLLMFFVDLHCAQAQGHKGTAWQH